MDMLNKNIRSIIVKSRYGIPREPTFKELYHLRKFQKYKKYDSRFLYIYDTVSYFKYDTHISTIHDAYEFSFYS